MPQKFSEHVGSLCHLTGLTVSLTAKSGCHRIGRSKSGEKGKANLAVQVGFLDAAVSLPGGYRTSRRDLFKLASLASGSACVYIALTRAKVRALNLL